MREFPPKALHLQLSSSQTDRGLTYQVLQVELTASDRLIEPQDLVDLQLPAGIDTAEGVVISGRAPVWLFAYLTSVLYPTAWVGCYDPRLGTVIVSTNSRQVSVGQVISIHPANGRKLINQTSAEDKLSPALMVVGPPDSGKSVFSHASFQALLPNHPDIYLQRAHWDGEGNYVLELAKNTTDDEIEQFKANNRGALTERFFPYHAQAILKLRMQKSLVIVDVGGMVQPEKLPLLEACSHYLIISSKPEAINAWHEFCRDRGNLIPVAVIHSSLQEVETVHQTKPYLEVTSGPWIRGEVRQVSEILLNQIKSIFTLNK
ncbi:MAG: CRISPR-associated protein Csx3 [Cyanomargarita calcarea GSE-NOS-MK-12-04C]|jgi:CRISPR-associated protein Csx3|uniref:CRISPR-associated protein Csx3 n=1 Tax=Cyanomargarita calcarea GSE-NOS-MK-12-04C TaxID=2839659 RepID=A0A951UUB7_9CYAN|nr:CRISPR-associated protein Csx3 [Cyanomargarita calcarea GSE-NOS-MK-12-04C]